MIKALYVIAIGLLFAAFIAFGESAIYPQPQYPDCGKVSPVTSDNGQGPATTNACQQQIDNFDAARKHHDLIISLTDMAIAVLVIVVSLVWLGKFDVIGDGLTLGGIFTLFVGIVSAIENTEIFRFLAVTAGLAIILFLSYWKFVRQQPAQPSA